MERSRPPQRPRPSSAPHGASRRRFRRAFPELPLRPTAYGAVVGVAGIALGCAAWALGSAALFTGALGILCAHALSLAGALLGRGGSSEGDLTAALRSALLADTRTWRLYDRLDEGGRIVDSFTSSEHPAGRGLFMQRRATTCWTGMFWLWRATSVSDRDVEVCQPPRADAAHDAMPAKKERGRRSPVGKRAARDTSLIRPYEAGDELSSIAWRLSAHHDELISFERAYDDDRRILLIADTGSAGSESEMDALAAGLLACWERSARPAGGCNPPARLQLTDGDRVLADSLACKRFCAALFPSVPRGASDAREQAEERGRRIVRTARSTRAASMVLVTLDDESDLARAIAETEISRFVTCIQIDPRARRSDAPPAAEAPPFAPASENVDAPARPSREIASMPLDAIAIIAPIVIVADALSQLFSPGLWHAVVLACAAVLACEAVAYDRACRSRRARALRLAIPALVTASVLAGGAYLVHRVAIEPLGAGFPSLATTPFSIEGIELDGPLATFGGILYGGLASLYYGQWVPVTVSPWGDAALIFITCCIATLLQPLVLGKRSRPLIALASLATIAAPHILLDATEPLHELAIAIACGCYLLARSHDRSGDAPVRTPGRAGNAKPLARTLPLVRPRLAVSASERDGKRPPSWSAIPRACSPCIPCILIGLIASLSAQPLCDLADNSLRTSSSAIDGFLAAQGEKPLVDLRRDLARTEERNALTCVAVQANGAAYEGRLYLRTHVLDGFNGTTWFQDDADTDQNALVGTETTAAEHEGETTAMRMDAALPLSNIARVEQASNARLGSVSSLVTTIRLEQQRGDLPTPAEVSSISAPDDSPLHVDSLFGDACGNISCADGETAPAGSVYVAASLSIEPIHTMEQIDALEQAAGIVCDLVDTQDAQGDAATLQPARPDARYLSLPDDLPASIRKIRNGALDAGIKVHRSAAPSKADALDQVAAMRYLMAYFAEEDFRYTTTAPKDDLGNDLDAIDEFLRKRDGYCVHYASALAILGRSLGVPTRIAIGYKTRLQAATEQGDAQPGAAAPVRYATNHDLHAWTEAYIDNVGWIPFDCTPAQTLDLESDEDAPAGLSHSDESIALAPLDEDGNAIDPKPDATSPEATSPDGSTENAGGSRNDLVQQAQHIASDAMKTLEQSARYALPLLATCTALLAPCAARRLHRARARRAARSAASRCSREAASMMWREITDTALDAGLTWSPADTEEDIVRIMRVDLDEESLHAVEDLTRLIARARYGADPTDAACERIDELFDTTCRALALRGKRGAAARLVRALVPASMLRYRSLRQR